MDLYFDGLNRILVQGTWFRSDLVGRVSAMKASDVLSFGSLSMTGNLCKCSLIWCSVLGKLRGVRKNQVHGYTGKFYIFIFTYIDDLSRSRYPTERDVFNPNLLIAFHVYIYACSEWPYRIDYFHEIECRCHWQTPTPHTQFSSFFPHRSATELTSVSKSWAARGWDELDTSIGHPTPVHKLTPVQQY